MMSSDVRARFLPRVADFPLGAVFGPRRLDDHELVWMLEGAARWRVEHPDGTVDEAELRPGTVVLARPGDVDHYQWDIAGVSRHAYVHFDADLTGHDSGVAVRSLDGSAPLGELLDLLRTLSGGEGRRDDERCATALALALDLFLDAPAEEPEDPWGPGLAPAVDLVAAEWASHGMGQVPVRRLAAACGLSSGHFSRTFSSACGAGPAAALEAVRLVRAATLLQRSNMTVAQVARSCGFADAYHLSHRFSGAYHQSPGRYRRQRPEPDPLELLRTPALHALQRRLAVTPAERATSASRRS